MEREKEGDRRDSRRRESSHRYRNHSHSISPDKRRISQNEGRNASRYSPSFGQDTKKAVWRKTTVSQEKKQEPDYNPSGRLYDEKATKNNGINLKYCEPQDSSQSSKKWRIHVFKGGDEVAIIKLYPKSCYRVGRDPVISDILIEHESCSKQHAALQHRIVTIDKEGFGKYETQERLYIIDLESIHGTLVNGLKVEGGRYVELRHKDVLKFAYSTREYVVLLEDDEK